MPRPNPRDPEKDPSAALGESLRDLRTDAGFRIQEDFARSIGYARETVSRVETGDSLPGADVLNDWLDACQATPRERRLIDRQYKLARKSRGPIPQYFEVYVNREKLATFLRLWGLLLIPGPLQVYGYAHAMFMTWGMDEEEAAEKANARAERGKIIDSPNAPHVTVLIYEPVLYLEVGTPEVMITQLEHLLERTRQRNVIIQVVPASAYFPGLDGQFDIVSGPAITDTVDMITVKDYVTDDPDEVRTAAELFEEIRGYALNVAESRARIQEALQRCKSQQQTPAGASPATATAQELTA